MRTKRARKPQPDIAQSPPKSSGYADALLGAADVPLLIEVADTTIEYDRTVKLQLYAQHSIFMNNENRFGK